MKTENRLLRLPEVLERVPIEEFSQTFDYGLQDITKSDYLIKYLIGKIVLFIKQALRT